ENIHSGIERIGEASSSFFCETKRRFECFGSDICAKFRSVAALISKMQIGHRITALAYDPMAGLTCDYQNPQGNRAAGKSELRNPLFANHPLWQQQTQD